MVPNVSKCGVGNVVEQDFPSFALRFELILMKFELICLGNVFCFTYPWILMDIDHLIQGEPSSNGALSSGVAQGQMGDSEGGQRKTVTWYSMVVLEDLLNYTIKYFSLITRF